MSEKGYYAYSRWLEDDGSRDYPSCISGRDTDVSQIGYALYRKIRQRHPINEVPIPVKDVLDKLINDMKVVEESIDEFINWYSDTVVSQEDKK